MKKSYLALGLVAAVAMSSCSNDDPVVNPNQPAGSEQFVPVRLSMTTSTADVEVSGARTRGTGTVGSMEASSNHWKYEDIYVLMTSTQDRTKDAQDNETWGFTSALGNGPFLLEQFDGSFWARPAVNDNAISMLDYGLDRNEWWHGGRIDRFYPLSGGSHFFAYHIDDALYEGATSEISPELEAVGREKDHKYPTPTLTTTESGLEAYSVKFDLDGSQDLMAGYAAIPGDKYTDKDLGFSARSARADAIPQITMKHLLSRLTFQVVKGGDNFDRVTLNSIKILSKDKGEMIVALNPELDPANLSDEEPWEEVGAITWEEVDPADSFALKQVPNKYLVDENGKTNGIYTPSTTPYDVYYNIYDELYAYVDGTEKVFFEGEDLAAIEAAVALDALWVNGSNQQNGHIVCGDNVSGYYWEKPIKVKTPIAEDDAKLTTMPTLNTSAQTSLETGKAKLVDFAPVALKDFGLVKDDPLNNSKSVGEAMFVAPGEESYKLTLGMTYLVREGLGEDEAALEAAVAAAETAVAEATRDLGRLQEKLDAANADLEAKETALNDAKTDLATKQAELKDKQAAEEEAQYRYDQNPTDPALEAALNAAKDEVTAANNAVTAANNVVTTAQTAYDTAFAAQQAAQANVDAKQAELDEANANLLVAKDNLKKNPDVLENMSQELTLDLPNDATFEAGKSYNVRVVIYGYENIQVEVKLTPWEDGGEFEVGGDEGDTFTDPTPAP